MSNVNADATQLLTILKNMRTSISSIETTRSSVKMKYQQLGIGWNDKKYDELGTIVKDCNKALNDILQIMLQAEKYVASLAKSVQEYDNVNLDTPSARNSFLQGLQTPNVGNSSYQYCLGVLTQGSTPDGYIAVISQRHENAEQNVREVFDHFAGKLMIQDSEYPPDQTAHYSPGNYIGHSRGVYYNAASDMTNPRGAGTTYFHELAHMIDHASCNYRSNLLHGRELCNLQFIKGLLRRFMNCDFLTVFFKEFFAISRLAVLDINLPCVAIIFDVLLQRLNLNHTFLCDLDRIRKRIEPGRQIFNMSSQIVVVAQAFFFQ